MLKIHSIRYSLLFVIIAVISVSRMAASYDCPENEFYTDCGEDCQPLCSNLKEPCLIRHIRCPDGCYCNKGYARDDNGKCIPIKECAEK